MTAEFVVDESLSGFQRGQLFVIPGWRYRLLVLLIKILPGSVLRWGARRSAARYRKRSA
jgi:short-subunit dehydrogenase